MVFVDTYPLQKTDEDMRRESQQQQQQQQQPNKFSVGPSAPSSPSAKKASPAKGKEVDKNKKGTPNNKPEAKANAKGGKPNPKTEQPVNVPPQVEENNGLIVTIFDDFHQYV